MGATNYGGYQILVQKVSERDLSCDGLCKKLKFKCIFDLVKIELRCTKIDLTREHQFELKLTENIVITCSNSNLSAKNLNFSASQLNFDLFENALKFEFLAYHMQHMLSHDKSLSRTFCTKI